MGPLSGVRVVEVGGIGPGPFAGMMLADHGAEVIRVERPGVPPLDTGAVLRTRRIVELDLKSKDGVDAVRDLARDADILIEGFRPGIMERLGLGPDLLLGANPRLVYARMTGWGQDGPYAAYAGHDINYIALTGALHAIGSAGGPPVVPLNLIGDYGGGAMMLAFGILAAHAHAQKTGQGQVVDCAMTDGSALLMATFYTRYGTGRWRDERGVNLLDGAAPFYGCFETADGRHIALGSIEPPFYAALLRVLELEDDPLFQNQRDEALWPARRKRLEAIFATRSQAAWCELLEPADLCFAPVLGLAEAPNHPHNVARGTFVEVDGLVQPAPAPRYSLTPNAMPRPPETVNRGAASFR